VAGRSQVSEPKQQDKPFDISKWVVWEAVGRVKANKGAAGVDEESIAELEADRDRKLYKIGNRLSSGSYVPPPGKAVEIPKKGGKGGFGCWECRPWPTGSPRRWSGGSWNRRSNRSSTRTPTATGRAGPRWTRSRRVGSGAGERPG
jgi:hypothetical protein